MQTVASPVAGEELRNPLDEDTQPRARWERAVGWAIVIVATILAWNVLDANHNWGHFELIGNVIPWWSFHGFKFGDLFLNTTANGGDMGAHVWWPKFLETNWFPKGRLSGWAPDWYDGFPAGSTTSRCPRCGLPRSITFRSFRTTSHSSSSRSRVP